MSGGQCVRTRDGASFETIWRVLEEETQLETSLFGVSLSTGGQKLSVGAHKWDESLRLPPIYRQRTGTLFLPWLLHFLCDAVILVLSTYLLAR
jgi:hypothetical protein